MNNIDIGLDDFVGGQCDGANIHGYAAKWCNDVIRHGGCDNAKQCLKWCQEDTECFLWTYLGGQCYLKDLNTFTGERLDAISGRIKNNEQRGT